MPDKLWYLRRLNLFEGMSEDEVERVSRELRMRECSARSSVLDGTSERVYLVKRGRVRLYHVTQNGQEVTTAVLAPGQLFGLGALFSKGSDATLAEALEDTLVCDAGAQDFIGILARHPVLMAKVMMVMAKQMLRLEATIESIAARPVAGRLAELLLGLAENLPSRGNGTIVIPAYSHEELGKMIGASRESVTRTLSAWKRDGIIAAEGRRIVIRRRGALQAQIDAPADSPGRAG